MKLIKIQSFLDFRDLISCCQPAKIEVRSVLLFRLLVYVASLYQVVKARSYKDRLKLGILSILTHGNYSLKVVSVQYVVA